GVVVLASRASGDAEPHRWLIALGLLSPHLATNPPGRAARVGNPQNRALVLDFAHHRPLDEAHTNFAEGRAGRPAGPNRASRKSPLSVASRRSCGDVRAVRCEPWAVHRATRAPGSAASQSHCRAPT